MASWRPDLLSLRLFIAVCEEASIARAAERESLVSSAISKRISEIEELTGVTLLIRGARGVRPTTAGTAFLHHARQILRSTEKLQSELSEYAVGTRGHVRLTATISAITAFLPQDLSSFLRRHPTIRVDLQERFSQGIVDAVRDGSADIGICQSGSDFSDLRTIPYGRDGLVVVTHPAHPLATRTSIPYADALDYEFIALHPDSSTTRLLSSRAARIGRTLRHRMYVSTFEAACHLIAENLGIGLFASESVATIRTSVKLHLIPLDEDWSRREILMCVRDDVPLAPPLAAFVEHLQERSAQRPVRTAR